VNSTRSILTETPSAPPRPAWITGAGGLIGSHLARTDSTFRQRWRAIPLTHASLDLGDDAAVRAAFEHDQPELIIHCAALSKPTDCEQDPARARKLNVEATARLAELAANCALIFFSTDLVFDGRAGNYDEAAPVNPLSVYAETKVAAERIVLANPRHSVVRTSLNYGTSPAGDRAFNEEMFRAWAAGRTTRLFTDEFRCPIPAAVTAQAVWELAAAEQPGLYHLAGAERLSRWEVGQLVAAHDANVPARMEPCSLREYRGAPRPPDTSLNCAKIQKLLTAPLPRFSAWLNSPAIP